MRSQQNNLFFFTAPGCGAVVYNDSKKGLTITI